MTRPAADVFQVALHETGGRASWFQIVRLFVTDLFTRRGGAAAGGGLIISVMNTETGDELFRHIEDMGDDDGHLLERIQQDLGALTADEFAARWGS